MSNVLNEEKKQQVIALGKLGWTLRRIEQATGVRRETISSYLKAAGIAIRQPGGWGRRRAPAKPANEAGVITDFIRPISEKQPLQLPRLNPSASTCEPYRETIELGLSHGRNAMAIWQDMVTEYGYSGGYQTTTLRPQAAWIPRTRAGWNYHDSTRRRVPSRLRLGSDGARFPNEQVLSYATVRDDAGLQPQSGSIIGIPFQPPHVGRVA